VLDSDARVTTNWWNTMAGTAAAVERSGNRRWSRRCGGCSAEFGQRPRSDGSDTQRVASATARPAQCASDCSAHLAVGGRRGKVVRGNGPESPRLSAVRDAGSRSVWLSATGPLSVSASMEPGHSPYPWDFPCGDPGDGAHRGAVGGGCRGGRGAGGRARAAALATPSPA